jgi:hypothetical protein
MLWTHQLARSLVSLGVLIAGLVAPHTVLGAEDRVTYDPHVRSALSLLDANPSTSQLRGVLDRNHVTIRFIPMSTGVYARYSVNRHAVEIDARWAGVDDVTLAAVIAHEATHAQDAVNGYLSSGGASACIDSEVRAFRTSAQFWLAQYGPAGKPVASTDIERQLNSLASRELSDPRGLQDLVQQTYSQQCSH